MPLPEAITERDKEQRLFELSELGGWIHGNPNATRKEIAAYILQRVIELCSESV